MNDKLFGSRLHLRKSMLFVGALLASQAQAVTGVFQDQGGAVFNVMAYGASGTGAANDAPAIQNAINAAITVGGGVVYFPAGIYLLNTTVVNSRADIVSLVGTGIGSQLRVNTSLGVSLPAPPPSSRPPWQAGRIESLRFLCTAAPATALQMTDIIVAPALQDLNVANCDVGFHIVNQTGWTERLMATRISDDHNNHLFHYDNNASNPNNSFAYGIYNGIYLDKGAGQDAFYVTGGGYLYHSTFVIKGNFDLPATGASIFNVQGAAGQPCPGAAYNTVDIAVEGSGYQIVKAANNSCLPGPTGNAIVQGYGIVSAIGAVAGSTGSLQSLSNAAFAVGQLTTTASSADTLSGLSTVSPSSKCHAQPSNAVASTMINGTYVSGVNWGAVTLTHPAVAGGVFQIWCQ